MPAKHLKKYVFQAYFLFLDNRESRRESIQIIRSVVDQWRWSVRRSTPKFFVLRSSISEKLWKVRHRAERRERRGQMGSGVLLIIFILKREATEKVALPRESFLY